MNMSARDILSVPFAANRWWWAYAYTETGVRNGR